MAETILLVEDDRRIGQLISTYLRQHGFELIWVTEGKPALAEVQRRSVQLTLLDLGLPDVDGIGLCRSLAERCPVIVVTARDDEADRVIGLELGADDYITKPFSPRELLARVRAVLRRSTRRLDSSELRLGPVTISRAAREARVDGREIELTAREFDLLAYLAERPGIVLSRDALLEGVWGIAYPGGTRTVDVHMASLRRKLGHPELIGTVHRAGYKAARS